MVLDVPRQAVERIVFCESSFQIFNHETNYLMVGLFNYPWTFLFISNIFFSRDLIDQLLVPIISVARDHEFVNSYCFLIDGNVIHAFDF